MKINEFSAEVTRLEGGKDGVNIAQTSELLKIINRQLWGIPYVLIRFKKLPKPAVKAVAAVALLLMLSGCATLHDACQGNHRPHAKFTVTQ